MPKLKSIREGYLYELLNGNGVIDKTIIEYTEKGKQLGADELELTMSEIARTYKIPLKSKVCDYYQEHKIKVISLENNHMTKSIPFFATGSQNGPVAYIPIDAHSKRDKDGNYSIPTKNLYCLLEGAYILLSLINGNSISSIQALQKLSNNYANMILRIFNKKFSLNLDRVKQNKLRYALNVFYLENLLQMDNEEVVSNIAIINCSDISPTILKNTVEVIKRENGMDDINKFINSLTNDDLQFGFKDLTTRNFLESFISMYGPSNLLSLEYVPYFVFNLFAAKHGAFINNQYTVTEVIDKNVDKAYIYFL